MTDRYQAYDKLDEMGYYHHIVNHSEKEYVSGENEIDDMMAQHIMFVRLT